MEIPDPVWRDALGAISAGDRPKLEALLASHPELVRDRLEGGEGYFARPYLLWFVAENPIRTGSLPANIAELTRVITAEARRQGVLAEQIDYALGLVCSGLVPREGGVQGALIDALVDEGAKPAEALRPALPHRELAAVEHLLARGAALDLMTAASLGRLDDVRRLGPGTDPVGRQAALMCAAVNAQPAAVRALLEFGVNVNAYGAPGFHAHTTALHQAVNSDSLETVKVLVEAGAELTMRDKVFDGTPLGWAKRLGRTEIAVYLGTR